MTEKLFWLDSYQKDFTARLVEQFPVADGNAVVLDRTCFYATSGGQPNDVGSLAGQPVKDVRIEGDRLIHVVPTPVSPGEVTGSIDWERRFDHMQQHTGQHILSAAFYRLFQAETSSFHLGDEVCTIELSRPDLLEAHVRRAEETANQVVKSAAPVRAFLTDPGQAQEINLRKQPDIPESLRIVQVGDFDVCACSGTHVRNAAEVGTIFVYGLEKLSQSVKVTFLCGDRVRRRYAGELAILKSISRTLTTSFDKLSEAIARLHAQTKELRRENMQLKEGRLKAEAVQLIVDADEWKGKHLVIGAWDRPYQEVRLLAQTVSEQPDVLGAFISVSEKRAVFFKHPRVTADLRPLFQKFLAATSAKGGGAPHLMEAGNVRLDSEPVPLLQTIFALD